MTENTLEIVLKITAKHFKKNVETLNESTHIINDLKGDSLDAVELVMNIEDHFNIEIPEDDMTGVRTLGGIAEVVAQVISKKK
jgi:acyl carrier protein